MDAYPELGGNGILKARSEGAGGQELEIAGFAIYYLKVMRRWGSWVNPG